jgi:hypothetical protein
MALVLAALGLMKLTSFWLTPRGRNAAGFATAPGSLPDSA